MKFFSALTAQLVGQLLGLLVGLTTLVATSTASDVDDAWKDFLVNPPSQAVEAANELQQRADGIANNLSNAKLAFDLTDIDVVCSGGGNFDAFYMGAR